MKERRGEEREKRKRKRVEGKREGGRKIERGGGIERGERERDKQPDRQTEMAQKALRSKSCDNSPVFLSELAATSCFPRSTKSDN